MCDTFVAVPPATQNFGKDTVVWFGKNSDREPGEAQIVEHLPAQKFSSSAKLQCTYVEVPQATETYEVVLSRPFWMWGAEMGTNSRGVAIGNEAVFTKLPVPKTGLTGMDLLRLALERSASAREALNLITRFIQEVGQGGLCGYRHKGFRYHNSFIIADPTEAWVLETADRFWAAERVRGVRTISNVLTIGKEFDLLSDGAFEFAKDKGWCKSANEFEDPLRPSLVGSLPTEINLFHERFGGVRLFVGKNEWRVRGPGELDTIAFAYENGARPHFIQRVIDLPDGTCIAIDRTIGGLAFLRVTPVSGPPDEHAEPSSDHEQAPRFFVKEDMRMVQVVSRSLAPLLTKAMATGGAIDMPSIASYWDELFPFVKEPPTPPKPWLATIKGIFTGKKTR